MGTDPQGERDNLTTTQEGGGRQAEGRRLERDVVQRRGSLCKVLCHSDMKSRIRI